MVLRLPYFVSKMGGRSRKLITANAVKYLNDVLEHGHTLLSRCQSPELVEENLDLESEKDLDLDSYIRTDAEVNALQPLYEKYFNSFEKNTNESDG